MPCGDQHRLISLCHRVEPAGRGLLLLSATHMPEHQALLGLGGVEHWQESTGCCMAWGRAGRATTLHSCPTADALSPSITGSRDGGGLVWLEVKIDGGDMKSSKECPSTSLT